MPEAPKSRFENINDLIKAILWPLIVLIILISYHREFTSIIQLIPKKLDQSSKISVGSLSFEIEKSAKSAGNAELADIIKNLSEKGIRKLLTLGSGNHSMMIHPGNSTDPNYPKQFSLPVDIDILKELEKSGLLLADEPIDKFLKYLKTLHPTQETEYVSPSGSTTREPRDSFTVKFDNLIIPVASLSPEDYKKVDSYMIRLSDTGKKAFEIIVHVIAEQINKDRD